MFPSTSLFTDLKMLEKFKHAVRRISRSVTDITSNQGPKRTRGGNRPKSARVIVLQNLKIRRCVELICSPASSVRIMRIQQTTAAVNRWSPANSQAGSNQRSASPS